MLSYVYIDDPFLYIDDSNIQSEQDSWHTEILSSARNFTLDLYCFMNNPDVFQESNIVFAIDIKNTWINWVLTT